MTEPRSPSRVSDDAVRRATGQDWAAWFAALDAAGAHAWTHKEIVAWLAGPGGLTNGWWQQSVTVEYEKERGLRAPVGETADAGFQVGAQRTLDLPAAEAWSLLMERPGPDAWLGAGTDFRPTPGHVYRAEDGTHGEVRTVRPGFRVRLTWHPPDWRAPTTLQITLTPKGERTTVGFHHERLPDAEARTAMRARWTRVLDTLQGA